MFSGRALLEHKENRRFLKQILLERLKMDINPIAKTLLPAIVVLVAGLFGINFVYNTYLKDGAASVITLEPAAGEDGTTVSVEDGATSVTTEIDGALVTTTTETTVEAIDECATAKAAAEAAVGTDTAEAASVAFADCETAKAAKASADADVDTATEAAVDAAAEGVVEDAPAEKAAE